jgi:hypothetical protein
VINGPREDDFPEFLGEYAEHFQGTDGIQRLAKDDEEACEIFAAMFDAAVYNDPAQRDAASKSMQQLIERRARAEFNRNWCERAEDRAARRAA